MAFSLCAQTGGLLQYELPQIGSDFEQTSRQTSKILGKPLGKPPSKPNFRNLRGLPRGLLGGLPRGLPKVLEVCLEVCLKFMRFPKLCLANWQKDSRRPQTGLSRPQANLSLSNPSSKPPKQSKPKCSNLSVRRPHNLAGEIHRQSR